MQLLTGNIPDITLGEIAAKDVRKAQVFKKYGLDFCCGGKKTVKEACLEKGLDITRIEQELLQANENITTRPIPYQEWGAAFLADYIIHTHHSYVRKVLPEIEELAYKVVKAHGHLHPELAQIQQIIHTVGAELNIHMLKEENVLFPYIKQMEAVANKLPVQETIHLETVQLPINMMEMDHELAGSGLESIRLLSNNFTPPADSCASFRLLYTMLREFEEDLHLHVHLENNILFPKAIAMEKGMNGLSPDQ